MPKRTKRRLGPGKRRAQRRPPRGRRGGGEGGPRKKKPPLRKKTARGSAKLPRQTAKALKRAKALGKVFAEVAGLSHRAAAKALNKRGIKTVTGKASWSTEQVKRVRQHLGRAPRK